MGVAATAVLATGCGQAAVHTVSATPARASAAAVAQTLSQRAAARAPSRTTAPSRHYPGGVEQPGAGSGTPPPSTPQSSAIARCFRQLNPGPTDHPKDPATKTVPDVTGDLIPQAATKLNLAGLDSGQMMVTVSGHPACHVVGTSPPAGTKVVAHYWVTLLVASPVR